MKKNLLLLILAAQINFAQNTFPPTGPVGIGTSTPNSSVLLDVNGKAIFRSLLYANDIMGGNGGDIRIGPNTGGNASTLFFVGGVNPTEIMRVHYNGNVGIGTSLPSAKLDVSGGIISSVSNPLGGYIKLKNPSKTVSGTASEWTIFNMTGNYGNSLQFWAYDDLDCANGGMCSNRFTIMDNGNVGIGTNSPTANLEINAPAITGAETLLKLRVSDAPQDYIRIGNGTNSSAQFLPNLVGYRTSDVRPSLYLTASTETATDTGNDALMVFDSRTSAAAIITRPLFSWDSYGNRKMVLNANGSLGIGTTATGNHKLAVEGSIGAREIKVQATGWSDFVFKKEYTLPTLEEVEKHIAEKGHLENIPNEEEVLKNGINLGEMNAKLLQKIEELTLYVIEQNKRLDKVEKENNDLRNLIESHHEK
ncbi:hypothetical protein [Flavobacterium sp. 1355]|uniref:hypothetical protein n=1 Tax=Flavobacterium sp. 1355 TaxID=2806571 RepID=UPI001AE6436C|nr:hypothetical protein [Flavobacterium sp. 1355]MBP1221763.1 hypothetical protein [Flavobacterium sp. 1355]